MTSTEAFTKPSQTSTESGRAIRWTDNESLLSSKVSARRLRVEFVRKGQLEAKQMYDGPDQSLGLAQGRAEHGSQGQGRRDGQRRVAGLPTPAGAGSARQAAIAASANQTVRLLRWRRAASYAVQFVTLCCCFGMCRRQAALALNGTSGVRTSEKGPPSYTAQLPTPTGQSVQQDEWDVLEIMICHR